VENELLDSRLHCSSVFHLVRMRGPGKDYVLPLYELSMRVAGQSGRFFPRLTDIALYLDCHRNQLYRAAELLRAASWWEVVGKSLGKAVEYHPLSHDEWVAAYGDALCCKKLTMPWAEEPQDQLGKDLYAVTGGMTFFPSIIKGWRSQSGMTDEQIVERAKKFMQTNPERVAGKPARFRKQLGEFIRKA
jgi:hypothetical protein